MKKCIALMLTLCLTLAAVCGAFAEAVVSKPAEYNPDDGYTAAVDVENNMTEDKVTFNYYLDDMYKTAELAALKPGDVIHAWGEDTVVETVEATRSGDEVTDYEINGGFIDGGLSFGVSETDADLCYCLGYDALCARTEAGTMTLPMAKEVKVGVYVMKDGAYDGDMEFVTMPAAQVKAYLLEKADPANGDDAISLEADFTLFEENGEIVEMHVKYAPNV